MYIPHEIYQLIWAFSYNTYMKTNIFSDLEFVINTKKHIPCIFFNQKVPTKNNFEKSPPDLTFLTFYRDSPFIDNNAYLPTSLLFKDSVINLNLIHHMIDMLKKSALYSYGTRRYFAHRTACAIPEYIFTGSARFLQYTKLFYLLSEHDNYKTNTCFDGFLAHCVVHDLDGKLPSDKSLLGFN